MWSRQIFKLTLLPREAGRVARRGVVIVGREQEQALLDAFVRGEDGRLLALLVGEAGIGKSALWSAALDRGRESGATVLIARPAAAESTSSFAALGDLLQSVVDRIACVPELPRRALNAALLIEPARAPPELRAVALGVLALLRELGRVVVAVDDWQWLDASSATVLTFALRRAPSGVRVLATVRSGVADQDVRALVSGLPEGATLELAVGPLGAEELGALIEARSGRCLSPRALAELQASSGGNPLTALEVVRADQAGGLAVATDVQRLLGARIAALSPIARDVLRAAAALALPTASLLERATGEAAAGRRGLEEALVAEVLERDGERLRFAHPLLARAVEDRTPPAAWRAMHRRLADIVDDIEERARHLGQATAEPDAGIAASLEAAAEHAAARGASAAAAGLASRAGDLTRDRDHAARVRRKLLASDAFERAGDGESARRVLEALVEELRPGPDRARALYRLAALFWDARTRRFGEQALAEAGADDRLRAEIEVTLANALHMLDGAHAGIPHAERALAHAKASGDRLLQARSLAELALHRFAAGQGMQRETLTVAARLESACGMPTAGWILLFQLAHTSDFAAARDAFASELPRAQATGQLDMVAEMHTIMAEAELRAGRPADATAHVDRLMELNFASADGSGYADVLWIRALLDAHRGRAEAAERAALRGLEIIERGDDRITHLRICHVLGVLALSRGQGNAAAGWLASLPSAEEALGVGEPGIFQLGADVAEALLLVGDVDGAEAAVTALERHHGHPWASGAGLRGRAMLHAARGDLDRAIAGHLAALDALAAAGQPLEIGRTLLALGVTQRRAKQRAAARRSLEAATAAFAEVEAPLWAERATAEIGRLGGRRTADRDELTEAERRIAELAADGRSNRDIAALLFVSERTVESNLTRAYRKLGVRSRTQLARRLAGRENAGRT